MTRSRIIFYCSTNMTCVTNNHLNMIPSEVIINNIVSFLNMGEVIDFTSCSKQLYQYQDEAFDVKINNNMFLNQYLSKRNIELVTIIEQSSFTKREFFQFFDSVDNHEIFDESIRDIDISNNTSYQLLQTTIDSTFELFKVLMCLSMFHMKLHFRDNITLYMIRYFKNVYFAKYKQKSDTSHDVFMKFIENRDELLWYTSNINLYNIYENINLMHFDRRSFALKQNMEHVAHDSVAIVEHNHVHTISLLMKIFTYLDCVEDQIYILYSIFQYTTIILLNNSYEDDVGFNFKNFTIAISEKIDEFEEDIEIRYRTCIPRSISSIMLERAKNLKDLIKNNI